MSLLGKAVALWLLLEGLGPMLAPERWRQMLQQIAQASDSQLQWTGAVACFAGVALFWWCS